MSTIYIVLPKDERRVETLNDLLDNLQSLYPNKIISLPALAITTDVPELVELLNKLAGQPAAPAAPKTPAKKSVKAAAKKSKLEPRNCPYCQESYTPHREDQICCGKPECTKKLKASYYRRSKVRKDGNGAGGSGLSLGAPAVTEGEPAPEGIEVQSYNWRILRTGKELNNISHLLKSRKLVAGDQLRHKKSGLYQVIEGKRGLTCQRIEGGQA